MDERAEMRWGDELSNTYCIGRQYVALPIAYTPSPVVAGMFKFSNFPDGGPSIEVKVTRTTAQGFRAQVAKRREELKSGGADDVDVLRYDKALGDDTHLFRVQAIADAYASEVITLKGENIVTARLESYRNTFLQAEDSLQRFAAEIVDLSNGKPQGFCMGSVGFSGRYKAESAKFSFIDQTGTRFDFDIDTYAPDDEIQLLRRISGPGTLLKSLSFNHGVLRSGERIMAGMRSQEWLGWAKLSEDSDDKSLKFMAETMRPVPGVIRPKINVKFVTSQALADGTPTSTSISNGEAMALWDHVLNSIRLQR